MATTKQHEKAPPVIDPSMVEPLVDAEAVAPMLGCTASTVREWHHKHGLPATRIGGRLKFLVSEVLAWRDARRTVVVRREDVQSQAAPPPGQPRRRMTKAEARVADEEFPY